MPLSSDLMPSDLDWVHEIAKNELNPESLNIFNSVNQFDPRQIIEESTIDFLEHLRELFQAYANVFNSYSQNNQKFSELKIYGISNSPANFMLFRNNVKLVFSNSAHGIINATFTTHNRQDVILNGGAPSAPETSFQKQAHDMIAQLGPFLDVVWTYQGEKINANRLVKYFFIEFIKASRVPAKVSTNQLLLKQIKALLNDQGIDL